MYPDQLDYREMVHQRGIEPRSLTWKASILTIEPLMQKKEKLILSFLTTPTETRTQNLVIRSHTRYPIAPLGHRQNQRYYIHNILISTLLFYKI